MYMPLTGLRGCDALMKKLNFENILSITRNEIFTNPVFTTFIQKFVDDLGCQMDKK